MCIYWLTNNVITTAQQVYLKNTTKVELPSTAPASAQATDSSGAWTSSKPEVLPAQGGDNGSGVGEGASSETNGARRSRKGEKFKARQVAQQDAEVEKLQQNSRGKKKGAKFAQRRAGGSKDADDSGGKGEAPATNGAAAEDSKAQPAGAAATSQSQRSQEDSA